jgi:hypothetical protein
MNIKNKIGILIFLVFLLFILEVSNVLSIEPKEIPKPGPSTEELKKPSGIRVPPCSDLKANLEIRKRIEGTKGIIELHGQICNVGAIDYNSSVGAIAKLEVRDPLTGVTQTLQSRSFRSLAKENCIDMTSTYTIEKFISWEENPPSQRACRSQRLFKLSVAPTQGRRFTQIEDCRGDNNSVSELVKFWIECPQ